MAKSKQIKNIMPNHVAMVDWEISHPGGTMRECAKELGLAESTISIVRNSDAFEDYRQKRLEDHHKLISETIIEKAERTAGAVLDTLHDKVMTERSEPGAEGGIGVDGLLQTGHLSFKALGIGQTNSPPAPTANITILNSADPELLARARARMLAPAPETGSGLLEGKDVTETEELPPAR